MYITANSLRDSSHASNTMDDIVKELDVGRLDKPDGKEPQVAEVVPAQVIPEREPVDAEPKYSILKKRFDHESWKGTILNDDSVLGRMENMIPAMGLPRVNNVAGLNQAYREQFGDFELKFGDLRVSQASEARVKEFDITNPTATVKRRESDEVNARKVAFEKNLGNQLIEEEDVKEVVKAFSQRFVQLVQTISEDRDLLAEFTAADNDALVAPSPLKLLTAEELAQGHIEGFAQHGLNKGLLCRFVTLPGVAPGVKRVLGNWPGWVGPLVHLLGPGVANFNVAPSAFKTYFANALRDDPTWCTRVVDAFTDNNPNIREVFGLTFALFQGPNIFKTILQRISFSKDAGVASRYNSILDLAFLSKQFEMLNTLEEVQLSAGHQLDFQFVGGQSWTSFNLDWFAPGKKLWNPVRGQNFRAKTYYTCNWDTSDNATIQHDLTDREKLYIRSDNAVVKESPTVITSYLIGHEIMLFADFRYSAKARRDEQQNDPKFVVDFKINPSASGWHKLPGGFPSSIEIQDALGYAVGAGPSGTTSDLGILMMVLNGGNRFTAKDFVRFRKALMGFMLSVGHHTFLEVLLGAEPWIAGYRNFNPDAARKNYSMVRLGIPKVEQARTMTDDALTDSLMNIISHEDDRFLTFEADVKKEKLLQDLGDKVQADSQKARVHREHDDVDAE
jgi:hypothetical protein